MVLTSQRISWCLMRIHQSNTSVLCDWPSRIIPSTFLQKAQGFISKILVEFSLRSHIPPWLEKNFRFKVLRLLEKGFVKCLTCLPSEILPPMFLPSSITEREITYSPRHLFSEHLLPSVERGMMKLCLIIWLNVTQVINDDTWFVFR